MSLFAFAAICCVWHLRRTQIYHPKWALPTTQAFLIRCGFRIFVEKTAETTDYLARPLAATKFEYRNMKQFS